MNYTALFCHPEFTRFWLKCANLIVNCGLGRLTDIHYGETSESIGTISFCQRYTAECDSRRTSYMIAT